MEAVNDRNQALKWPLQIKAIVTAIKWETGLTPRSPPLQSWFPRVSRLFP